MRNLLLPLSALTLIGATKPPAPEAAPAPSPGPVPAIRELAPIAPTPEQCRDRITQARDAAGKPPLLDRGPASPDRPYHIYAVDKRIDGCAVMMMHGDVNDVRPIPQRAEVVGRIIPLTPHE